MKEEKKDEFTEITEEMPAGKKKKRKSPKVEKLKADEIAEKLDIIFSILAKIFGYQYPYTAADFEQESKAIVRLSTKFPYLSSIIELFDPVLTVLGLWIKWNKMEKIENKNEKKDVQPQVIPYPPEVK